jgi:hypothetical protein
MQVRGDVFGSVIALCAVKRARFPKAGRLQIHGTNPLERLNVEVKVGFQR